MTVQTTFPMQRLRLAILSTSLALAFLLSPVNSSWLIKPSGSGATSDSPGTTNMVSYWDLDEASGNRADSHGSITLNDNFTVLSASAIVSDGADFETENNEFLSATDPASMSFGDTDFQICVWVNLETNTAGKGVIAKWHSTGSQREWMLRATNAAGGSFQFFVSDDGTGTSASVTETTVGSPSLATWYFVIAYHDATANEIGISVTPSSSGTLNAFDTVSHSTGTHTGTGDLEVGRYNASTSSDLDGIVDELVIFSARLTSLNEAWIFNGGSGRAYSDY